MALTSTYQLQHSLPNRAQNHRPRSMSLADYQSLDFDREALASAYQSSLSSGNRSKPPLSTGTSWQSSIPSSNSYFTPPTTTEDFGPSSSTLSHHLRPGDNPHSKIVDSNFAGIGAGHSLTPPQSPFQQTTPKVERVDRAGVLSPVRENSGLGPGERRPSWMRRGLSASDLQDPYNDSSGFNSEPEGNWRQTGRPERNLPSVPTNVPPPELPAWEPDYKPQIPDSLTAPSAQNAYAQLSAPPPNLPPRRGNAQAGPSAQPQASSSAQAGPSSGPSRMSNAAQQSVGMPQQSTSHLPPPPPGVQGVEIPPQQVGGSQVMSPTVMSPTSPVAPVVKPHRPEAEKDVFLRSTDRTPIWSTHFIDPTLRNQTVKIPHQVTNITNIALSGLSGGPKEKYNSTIGAPIDGLAKMAKEWMIAPDGRFVSQEGGIEVGIGIVDSGRNVWGQDKGRQRARIEVESKYGGCKVEIIEIDENRQLDLKVETKSGDILVLLPDTFWGPLHIKSPGGKPSFLPGAVANLEPIANPYGAFYTTFILPPDLREGDKRKSKSAEYRTMAGIDRYVPKSFREESEMLDQVVAGYTHHTRGRESKVSLLSAKGKIVIGLRDSRDEEEAGKMRLAVGAQAGSRKKKWWK